MHARRVAHTLSNVNVHSHIRRPSSHDDQSHRVENCSLSLELGWERLSVSYFLGRYISTLINELHNAQFENMLINDCMLHHLKCLTLPVDLCFQVADFPFLKSSLKLCSNSITDWCDWTPPGGQRGSCRCCQ